MERLLIPVAACVVAYVALVVATTALLDLPAAVVCERGTTLEDVEVSSTRIHGYFDERHIGPCVAYIHRSTDPSGD